MNDPIELPVNFPVNSVQICLGFLRGKNTWNDETRAAIITVLAWASQFTTATRLVGGQLPDPSPNAEAVAISGLESAIEENANPAIKTMGIIPWGIIAELLAKKLIEYILNSRA
jgi:hypothetical protein